MTGPKLFKFCTACQMLKPVGDYYLRSSGYLEARCKPCVIEANSRRKAERRQREREARLALPRSEVKVCTACGERKAKTEFYVRHNQCKECLKAKAAERYSDPEVRARVVAQARQYHDRTRPARRAKSLAKYGITPEQYDALFDEQGGRCAICRREGLRLGAGGDANRRNVLCVDHCHDSGEVRGLLCQTCNRAIGLMQDDPDLLRSAITYLTSRRAHA